MFKTFHQAEDLYQEVLQDRIITGAGAGTADRFPVRFVLFDNFRDCSRFVEKLVDWGNIAIQRIEYWMDDDYPDTMLTHKSLADHIHDLIRTTPDKYRIIMPFSELARFYNNKPERAEFNTLINTIKGFDTTHEGFDAKQRVYIPIVGLEGKMEHFRNDAQSFIWYFQNDDHQADYRLVLTDGTTYGVQGLDEMYDVADTVKKWLGFWRYPQLKERVISTSHAIFSHAHYAQPDNAFTYFPCKNVYEFLTMGLHLDVDCIDYREEESAYWERLARQINVRNFHFEQFFNEQFGIHNLADYTVFFKQWFEHKDSFMRWLLAKYYTHKFCNEGYICQVLQFMESYTDTALVQHLARGIFYMDNHIAYLEQRRTGLRIAAENGVELPQDTQEQVVSEIRKIAERQGIASAIPYLGSGCVQEKMLIIEWYKAGKLTRDDLRELYPDLYYYLSKTIANTEVSWVLDYIDAYKEAKVLNEYTEAISTMLTEKNADELAHYAWSHQFASTRTLLYNRTDISQYLWIDGLGVDWMPFIEQLVREYEDEGYYVNEVMLAIAQLPTCTENNKDDLLKLSNGCAFQKIGDLDEIAHSKRTYPQYIIDDLQMMRREIEKILKAHPGEKIAIVSDHGMTYLSQLCDGLNMKGFESGHWGRLMIYKGKGSPVKDDKYVILKDGKTICALRHESLGAKIPAGMGAHGGATPEEELVPIIIISPEKKAATWTAVQRSFAIEAANPMFEIDIFGLSHSEKPLVEYDGKIYAMTNNGSTYMSERLPLQQDVTTIGLRIGQWYKEYKVTIKLEAQEEDLFADF